MVHSIGKDNYIIVDLIKEIICKGYDCNVSLSNGGLVLISDGVTLYDDDTFLYLQYDDGIHLVKLDSIVGVFADDEHFMKYKI